MQRSPTPPRPCPRPPPVTVEPAPAMDLRHLRYFRAVAEDLSYSKAAKRLNIAQPALTRAVQELEASLGVTLLERNRRVVRMTAAGDLLLRETALLLSRLDETVRRVRRAAAGQSGEVGVGYIGPPTGPFLAPLLAAFGRSHPDVTVRLEERTPERVWEMVARGRLSLGLTRPVLGITGESDGLSSELLREEPLCVVVPAAHSWAGRRGVKWRELKDQPLMALDRREGVGLHEAVLGGCRRAQIEPEWLHTPSVIGTILTYVEAGRGLGITPESVAALDPSGRLRFVPLTPFETVSLVLVWRRDDTSPAAAAMRQVILQWRDQGRLTHRPAPQPAATAD